MRNPWSARKRNAEVLLGDRIAPIDLQRRIDQHDAFGQAH